MLVACWSVKGGVGTTVVAAALALHLARGDTPGVVLADLAGDAPAVLGLPEPESPGLVDWLSAGERVPADALARIEIDAAPGLRLLPRGAGRLRAERVDVLAALLARSPLTTVVDCGRADEAAASGLVRQAQRSLLVLRPCYMALRRAQSATVRPTGVVVLTEPGRVLSPGDIGSALDVPVVAELPLDPAVARLVDAGMLRGRLPRSLNPLRTAAV